MSPVPTMTARRSVGEVIAEAPGALEVDVVQLVARPRRW